jgi:hypothetical protein
LIEAVHQVDAKPLVRAASREQSSRRDTAQELTDEEDREFEQEILEMEREDKESHILFERRLEAQNPELLAIRQDIERLKLLIEQRQKEYDELAIQLCTASLNELIGNLHASAATPDAPAGHGGTAKGTRKAKAKESP